MKLHFFEKTPPPLMLRSRQTAGQMLSAVDELIALIRVILATDYYGRPVYFLQAPNDPLPTDEPYAAVTMAVFPHDRYAIYADDIDEWSMIDWQPWKMLSRQSCRQPLARARVSPRPTVLCATTMASSHATI
jgi:hypothetical protein